MNKLRNVAVGRIIDANESMFREEPANVFTTLSASIQTPISTLTGIPHAPRLKLRPTCILETLPTEVDELVEMEMKIMKSIPQKTWYDCIINHIPESMKKSKSNIEQKVMRLFESKVDDNTAMDYKPEKTKNTCERRYVGYTSEKDKELSLRGYLQKIRVHLRDMILKILVNRSCS